MLSISYDDGDIGTVPCGKCCLIVMVELKVYWPVYNNVG